MKLDRPTRSNSLYLELYQVLLIGRFQGPWRPLPLCPAYPRWAEQGVGPPLVPEDHSTAKQSTEKHSTSTAQHSPSSVGLGGCHTQGKVDSLIPVACNR